jgi:hypothetical protein
MKINSFYQKSFTGLLLIACCCFFQPARGQNTKPVYHLDDAQKNYEITATLPHHGSLTLHFARLSDWEGKAELERITNIGAEQYLHLKDSFKRPLSQKKLFLKLPIKEEVTSLQYEEITGGAQQMAYKDGAYFSLKTTMDTLRVIKDEGTYDSPVQLSNDSSQVIRQLGYTFVLRDLKDIESLAGDTATLNRIGHQIDSVLNHYRTKWKHPDWDSRSLAIKIDSGAGQHILIKNKGSFLYHTMFDWGVGLEFFNGKFCISSDVGLAYVEQVGVASSPFIALILNSYLFPEMDVRQSNGYSSIGIEFGAANTEGGTLGILRQKTSVGMAYFIGKSKNNVIQLPNMFRYYINYALSKNVSFGFEAMTNFKTSEKNRTSGKTGSITGLYLKFSF